jgi:hypothetical protein
MITTLDISIVTGYDGLPVYVTTDRGRAADIAQKIRGKNVIATVERVQALRETPDLEVCLQ